jgi:hypothetical protein
MPQFPRLQSGEYGRGIARRCSLAMPYAISLRSGSMPDAEEIKEMTGEKSIRGFIRLLPLVRPYVSRFANATSDNRGMPRTFMKWQLPQLWYSRRAIVAWGLGIANRGQSCRLLRAATCDLSDPPVRGHDQEG